MSDDARILIILGHPTRKSFGGALADAYEEGARAADCDVDYMDLSSMKFNATPTGRPGPLDPELVEARERILRASHLAFVYPTWMGAMPARMKGFFEQVFGSNWAFKFAPGAFFPERLLKGRSADVLVTMDTQPVIYTWVLGAPGHKLMKRAILAPSGIAPIRMLTFGPLSSSSEERRQKWLATARDRGDGAARSLKQVSSGRAFGGWNPFR
jgi:putative NADPH-quinone reductase